MGIPAGQQVGRSYPGPGQQVGRSKPGPGQQVIDRFRS